MYDGVNLPTFQDLSRRLSSGNVVARRQTEVLAGVLDTGPIIQVGIGTIDWRNLIVEGMGKAVPSRQVQAVTSPLRQGQIQGIVVVPLEALIH